MFCRFPSTPFQHFLFLTFFNKWCYNNELQQLEWVCACCWESDLLVQLWWDIVVNKTTVTLDLEKTKPDCLIITGIVFTSTPCASHWALSTNDITSCLASRLGVLVVRSSLMTWDVLDHEIAYTQRGNCCLILNGLVSTHTNCYFFGPWILPCVYFYDALICCSGHRPNA